VRAALAATTGVEGPADVAKYLLAGADVVMTTSALLRHGPEHAAVLLDSLSAWMARKGFATLGELPRDPLDGARWRRRSAPARRLRPRASGSQPQRLRPLVTRTAPRTRRWPRAGLGRLEATVAACA
jgi:hypothetical protein